MLSALLSIPLAIDELYHLSITCQKAFENSDLFAKKTLVYINVKRKQYLI
jgi:hypothetical protein